MKIIVDEMPNYPYECRNCRQEGDMEFHHWVCQVGEEKHICKDVKDCPYFIGLDEALRFLNIQNRSVMTKQPHGVQDSMNGGTDGVTN